MVDKDILLGNGPPRARMREVWRPSEDLLEEAQDDAVLVVLHDQDQVGIDIDDPGIVPGRTGKPTMVPRVVGPIRPTVPVQAREVAFLRKQSDKPIKITLPGTFTMAKMAKDEYYGDPEALTMAYTDALRTEISALKEAGADVIQLDEPHMQAHPADAAQYGVKAINRVLMGVEGPTIVHLCFGYAYVVSDKPSGYSFLAELDKCAAQIISIEAAQPRLDAAIVEPLPSKMIMFGALDLGTADVETPELVAELLSGALAHLPAERLIAAPDCGMKYLSRDVAFGKLRALADGAAIVRCRLTGSDDG